MAEMTEAVDTHDLLENEEALLSKHRAERKALQAQITQLKHQAPKGDKKRKKEAGERAALLERELDERHERQLQAYKQAKSVDAVSCEVDRLHVNGVECPESAGAESSELTADPTSNELSQKKPSKAQKRREKAAAAEREREERIAAQAMENLQGPRHLEQRALQLKLAERSLRLHEVPADGNCLYAALSHQLELREQKKSVLELRELVGAELLAHGDDYQPFMTDESGETLSAEAFERYCEELRSTNAWGGHVEIQAASRCLDQGIEVIQATGESPRLGQSDQPLLITYHRHSFGLGEHYNSVMPASDSAQHQSNDSRE